MDIEAPLRRELIDSLATHFDCFEEIELASPLFSGQIVRADVLAVSKTSVGVAPVAFAFEVKKPTERWELKNWLHQIKQAADYPFAQVIRGKERVPSGQITIDAAFIFPGPVMVNSTGKPTFMRDYDVEPLRGALLLAQHFRVGVADMPLSRLKLGTDTLWDFVGGFRPKCESRLNRTRLGSRQINTR